MTTNLDSTSVPPQPPAIPVPSAPTHPRRIFLRWLWRLLACNPFYIVSAMLLLYSMRCLSLDQSVFKEEASQLFFNVSSFHFYELLLVSTSIFLARRKIWYDSALLAGLENMFLFVPFILVSQALLLDDRFAFELCLAGSVLAGVRVGALKRHIASINLPARLMMIGAFLLCLNLGLPVATRWLHKAVSWPIWDGRGMVVNRVEWFLTMPLAVVLALVLPRKNSGPMEGFYSRRFFPLLALGLWICGTGAHIYCIGYVYNIPWRISLVAPAVWMAAWVLWKRRDDLDFLPRYFAGHLERLLLFTPPIALAIVGWDNNWRMFAALAGLNVAAYGTLAALRRDKTSFHLCLASVALVICSLPREWLRLLHFELALPGIFWGSLLTYTVLSSLFSRDPRHGLLSGLAIPMWIGLFIPTYTETVFHFSSQAAFVFFLLHSLRWEDRKHPGVNTARWLVGCTWLLHSTTWLMSDHLTGALATFLAGLSVLVVYFAARFFFGFWGPRAVPYLALAVMALPAIGGLVKLLISAPAGVL